MMNKFSTIVLFLWVCLAAGDVCDVIPSEENIDWSKFEGTNWYQVLNARDPESLSASCHVIQFLGSDKDTVDTNFILLDDSNPEKVDVIRNQFIKSGKFYTMNRFYEASWMSISLERERKKNPELVAAVEEETKNRYAYPIALYTDYETYFLGTRCTPDHHYAFAYAPTPHLTLPTALKIFNTLAKSNNAVLLYLAGCKDIENIESYIEAATI